ncbi:MAG TPA: TAXI family TRAP transporter solute-binding subunit [Hyphomicrobiaceae bacterium]|nr:TAXI family TRAP transporter solute-binding subunit [Hyphomicrobiaceae bacterium]
MDQNVAKASAVTVLAAGLGISGLAVLHNSQRIDYEGKIVIAAGAQQYYDLALRYKEELRKYGVQVEVRRTTRVKDKEGKTTLRPLEGRITLRALADDDSGITAGFVKGGLVGSLQGRLASEKMKGRHAEYSKLRSVGRLFHEPIWVFTRGDLPIHTLRDLKGKRILLGTRDSGGRGVARLLLRANGVTDNATLIDEDIDDSATALVSGTADAAIMVAAADTDKVQKLLRVPDIRLMDFKEEAEAYSNRFPSISKVVLRQGAVEFDPLIPSDDITLLSTSVALVVRPDMQPALVSLLTHAVVHNPKPGYDKNGDPVLFYKAGEFPSASDPEYEVATEARVVYKSGELPVVLKNVAPRAYSLHVPFSYTAFISDHAATLLGMVGILAIVLPLTRTIPAVYVWMVRRRLVYWYRQLKRLERQIDRGATRFDRGALQTEFDRIDSNVKMLRVPAYYSNQLYDLRGHIELVRQRLAAKPEALRMAAE